LKHCLQIATILTTLTMGSLAAAQDLAPQAVVVPPDPPRDQPREAPAPPPLAVGGEGRWVFDLIGGQIGTGVPVPLGAIGGLGTVGVGLVGLGPLTIASSSTMDENAGAETTYKS